MKNLTGNNRGSALLISLILMLMLAGLGMMTIDRSNDDLDLSYNTLHDEQAFHVAEAGAKRALVELAANASWRTGFTNESFCGGMFTVVVRDSSTDSTLLDTVEVISIGEIAGGLSQVELTLVPDEFSPFSYALFGDDWVEIKNSALTDSYNSDSGTYAATAIFDEGDVGSNGDIDVKNSADIGGDLATSFEGGLDINPGATVAGDTTSAADEQTMPPVSAAEFAAALASNDNATGLSGSYSYNAGAKTLYITNDVTLQSGTYFFTDITFKNGATMELAAGAEVVIYVDGNIEVKNSATINDGGSPKDLQIYSSGDFILKNSGDCYATFYSPEGNADLRNSGDFYGSVIANTLVVHNSAGFHYDRGLSEVKRTGDDGFERVAWGDAYAF